MNLLPLFWLRPRKQAYVRPLPFPRITRPRKAARNRKSCLAKVKIVPASSKYTGVFEGAECALFRLSFTYKVTSSKPVAPGFALKILRDGAPSANVSALVSLNGQGLEEEKVVSPRQLFFVPATQVKSSSEPHDVREDFHSIPEGTKIYELRALSEKHAGFDYSEYTSAMAESFVKESEHIADIVTTSEFVSSSFGDDGIFFRHQLRPR